MAMRGSLSFIELHLEKGLLGLAVLALAASATYFLILEPNKVEFSGQRLGPRELDEAIKRKAVELQQAVANQKPKAPEIPTYSRQLRESFESGIFTAPEPNAPALPSSLKIVARFGLPLPTFEGEKELGSVAIVTPLRPSAPAIRTGISLVRPEPLVVGQATKSGPSPEPEAGSAELSWVTVGAYFPLEAQRKEMLAAGYADFRAKVSVLGADVQRQELLASGEFSDWTDVPPGKAMPRFDIPAPAFDSRTGDLQNTKELEEKLKLAGDPQTQTELIQPPFFPVEAGDEWEPPLPGAEAGEDVEATEQPKPEPEKAGKKPPQKQGEDRPPGAGGRPRGQQPPAQPPPPGQRGGGFQPGQAPAQPPTGAKSKEALKEARKAYNEKDYDTAEQKAKSVVQATDATKSDKTQANKILNDIKRVREKQKKKPEGARTTGRDREKRELVKNPENDGEIAVWFHDDSVQPGKTYRYRLRVKLWNRYVGRRSALRDPTQAEKTLLAGEWSPASAPITVAPKRQFFVRGPVFGEPAANVEVYTWHKGHWLKEDFKVRVGDTIGASATVKTGETDKDGKGKKEQIDFATGDVVLDLRLDEPVVLRKEGKDGEFKYAEAKSLVLVYLDAADGQVKERIADLDKNDPHYKKLKDEWDAIK